MRLAVLTWNLYHGRAIPPAGRDLLPDFAAALAGWNWDLALLQEVPPWWPRELAHAAGAEQRLVMTSRNQLLPVRRLLAIRRPDLMRSGGGGCNAILARGTTIAEHRRLRLCRLPEQRWLHAIRLASGIWAANLHATAHDSARAAREAAQASAATLSWAAGAPAVLGGDFNLRRLELDDWDHAGGHDVDHIFVSGPAPTSQAHTLDHGSLSDHAPVMVTLEG
jgi:endonuclease/exonuclease/phosphatase family metal-dependent hydrolase